MCVIMPETHAHSFISIKLTLQLCGRHILHHNHHKCFLDAKIDVKCVSIILATAQCISTQTFTSQNDLPLK